MASKSFIPTNLWDSFGSHCFLLCLLITLRGESLSEGSHRNQDELELKRCRVRFYGRTGNGVTEQA